MVVDIIRWIRGQHRGVRFTFETQVFGAVPPERLTERPGGVGNSILWLMWHVSRTEDLMVNSLIRGAPQLLIEDGWGERMGVEVAHIGTGMADDEVEGFALKLKPEAVDEYWRAVATTTSEWLKTIGPDDLDAVPDFDARLAEIPPVLATGSSGPAIDFFKGRPVAFLLGGPVISHGYIHVGEMASIRGRLGLQAWF